MSEKRIGERELVLPSLWCMSQEKDKSISTSDLINKLRGILKPVGRDTQILKNRNDDHFSQKVRNLTSHDTFARLGFAAYKKVRGRGWWTMTPTGQEFLDSHAAFLEYAVTSNFEYGDVTESLKKIDYEAAPEERRKVVTFDENVTITEGASIRSDAQIYVRSRKLREAAVQHYKQNGRITCRICDFDFEKRYGPLGRDFIEIHHIKPIFAFEGEEMERTIKDALASVAPLCSNCHRMIHRRRGKIMLPEELRALIASRT